MNEVEGPRMPAGFTPQAPAQRVPRHGEPLPCGMGYIREGLENESLQGQMLELVTLNPHTIQRLVARQYVVPTRRGKIFEIDGVRCEHRHLIACGREVLTEPSNVSLGTTECGGITVYEVGHTHN